MIRRISTVKTFWVVFFASLAAVAIATAIFVGVFSANKIEKMRMSVVDDDNYYKVAQENNYRRSLYLACDSMKNLDANLGKAAVSQSAENQSQMLTNVVIHANQVNQNLAMLPIADGDNLVACQKFVNQTQDYATYLLKKISRGEELSVSDRTSLGNLDNVAVQLYDFLEGYAKSDSGLFVTNGNGMGNTGLLSDSLNNVEENSFAYEKLIYDGPFSDSVNKTLKTGQTVSVLEGGKIVEELFGSNQYLGTINHDGVWYSYETSDGTVLLTADGRVAQYQKYNQSLQEGKILSKQNCIEIAQEFCKKLGYNIEGVWVSRTQEDTTYVNCATVIDGVIVYPDLVKVAIDSYSGEIVGCEAKAYLLNHQDWVVTFGEVDEKAAQKTLSDTMTVLNSKKALVEKDNKHYLCYQFECLRGGKTYFVYVDSNTGHEVEILKVIDNTEGYTVI